MKLEPGIIYFFTGVDSDKVNQLWQTWDGFSDFFEYPECDFNNFKAFTEHECAVNANTLIEEFIKVKPSEAWLVITNSLHYFNRARLCVIRGQLNSGQVRFLFLNQDQQLIEICIDQFGRDQLNPEGFFTQNTVDLISLIQEGCQMATASKV